MGFVGEVKEVILRLFFRITELTCGVLLWVIYGGPGEKIPPINDLLLLDSATTLAYKIRTRKIKSVDVVKSFIERIKSINPILNCVVDDRFTDALETAQEVDEYLRTTNDSIENIARDKPFLGVPFTTKDCISIKGLCLTAGLHNRRGMKADEDADSVALLRNSGGIPLAITNVSELCMWWESNNTVHGRTNNPYNTNHIVGGSSGGEACLQAAAGSAMGIGSDIGGSIRMPAFFNGVFGHKPSTCTVSLKGHYPAPTSEDQKTFLGVGPMSRFATDLLPMFKVLCGKQSHVLNLDVKVDIKKLKYYYMEDDGGSLLMSPVDKEIKQSIHKIVNYLDKAYGIKAKRINIKKLKRSAAIWIAKMKVESGPQMCEQLTDHKGKVNTLNEVVKMLFGLSNHTLAAILTCVVESSGFTYGSSKYKHLVELCNLIRTEMEDIMGNDGVFIYPTHPTAAPYHVEPLCKPLNFAYTAIFNVLGFPATHCPMGLDSKGLPIGVQVVSSRNQDRLTLAVAVELEKAFGGWVPPSISV